MEMKMEIICCTGFYIIYIRIHTIMVMRIMIHISYENYDLYEYTYCMYGFEYFNAMPVFFVSSIFYFFIFNVAIGYYNGKCSVASSLSRHDYLFCSHVVITWHHE
jgi:hypothetical protein